MAGRINAADIQALKDRADIADVIGGYTSLQRAGGGSLKGLCPFHDEKTPSFHVDAHKGVWHCFGCGAGGDVISFVRDLEGLDFTDAVEKIARLTGFQLRYEELAPGQRRALGERSRILQVVAAADAFFRGCLRGDDGAAARDYLEQRGLGPDAWDAFGLGWAPDDWDQLAHHLSGEGFQPRDLVTAGVATQGRRGLIDRFRARVIFPIHDQAGRDVIAFGGRILPDGPVRTRIDGSPPKYINSPETPVYDKSATLYGLDAARREIVKREEVLIVEGYMDVIGLHLAGARHAVATCGTALTPRHFQLLERFAPRVTLALDADDAGYAAADKARALAEDAGLHDVGVLPMPPGTDPADLARSGGEEAVAEALSRRKTAVEFQIEHLLRDAPLDTPEAQADAYRRTFPLLARIEDRGLRYRYIRDVVARRVGLSAEVIEQELDGADRRPPPAGSTRPAPAGPGRDRAEGGVSGQARLERQVLQIALQRPDLLPEAWGDVRAEDFTADVSRLLFGILQRIDDLDEILAALPDDELRSRVRGLAVAELTIVPDPVHVAGDVARLRARSARRQRDEVRAQLRLRHEQLSPAERRALGQQLHELEQRLRELTPAEDEGVAAV